MTARPRRHPGDPLLSGATLDSRGAAAYLAIGLTRLYELVHSGEIAHVDLGGKFGFLAHDLDTWRYQHRIPSKAEREQDRTPKHAPLVELPDDLIDIFTGRPLKEGRR